MPLPQPEDWSSDPSFSFSPPPSPKPQPSHRLLPLTIPSTVQEDDDPFAGFSDDDEPTKPAVNKHVQPPHRPAKDAETARSRTTSLDLWDQDHDPDFPVGSIRLRSVLNAKGLTGLSRSLGAEEEDAADWGQDDEKESTIKGLAGLKIQQSGTIKGLQTISLPQASSSTIPPPKIPPPKVGDEDMESSFDLELDLTTLRLPPRAVRHKGSISSFSEFSSGTGGGGGSKGKERERSGKHDRERQSLTTNTTGSQSPSTSTTSQTSFSLRSFSSDPESPHPSRLPVMIAAEEEDQDGEGEEDMEEGLVLPSQTFFSSGMVGELNRLLDRKRRPQRELGVGKPKAGGHATAAATHHSTTSSGFVAHTESNQQTPQRIPSDLTRPTIASLARSRGHERREEAFEDGLVLEQGGKELSRGRLVKLRRARPQASGTTGSGSGSALGLGGMGMGVGGVVGRFGGAVKKAWEGRGGGRSGFIGADEWKAESSKLGMVAGGGTRASSGHEVSGSGLRTTRQGMQDHQQFRSTTNPSPSTGSSAMSGLPNSPSMGQLAGLQHQAQAQTLSKLRPQKSMARLQHPAPPPPISTPSLSRKQSLDAIGLRGAASAGVRDTYASPVPGSRTVRKSSDLDSGAAGVGSWGRSIAATSRASTPSDQGSWSRLTQPTSSSMAKARPSMSTIFPRPSTQRVGSGGSGFREREGNSQVSPPILEEPAMLKRPKKGKEYGDGTELDGFDDLVVDRGREGRVKVPLEGSASMGMTGTVKARVEPSISTSLPQIPPSSSRPLMAAVGDMTWNPQSQRWEGNYGVLRDFENHLTTSARPALITHYSGNNATAGLASPGGVTSSASSIKIVGDMRFDPEKMCWISTLAPEEDEPDPFEEMADDEDDEPDKGGTITKSAAKVLFGGINFGGTGSGSEGHRLKSETSGGSFTTGTEEESLDGVGASYHPPELAAAVDEALWRECREAETRHKQEVRGWVTKGPVGAPELAERKRREEKRLWEIWNLAVRS